MPADAGGGAAPITKVREYFPETMLWQPALITDNKGRADLGVNFADSITTWRLSASANSLGGALGGVNVPLKVFQDFFVDIDLPVALTAERRDQLSPSRSTTTSRRRRRSKSSCKTNPGSSCSTRTASFAVSVSSPTK